MHRKVFTIKNYLVQSVNSVEIEWGGVGVGRVERHAKIRLPKHLLVG